MTMPTLRINPEQHLVFKAQCGTINESNAFHACTMNESNPEELLNLKAPTRAEGRVGENIPFTVSEAIPYKVLGYIVQTGECSPKV